MNSLDAMNNLDRRKLEEIEHSRRRRTILQGYERDTDTAAGEGIEPSAVVIRGAEAFERHFSNMKFYSVAKSSTDYCHDWLRQRCQGATALDYCCGNGENALFAAQCGARTIGIDISPEGIANARLNAIKEEVERTCSFEVMDGEALTFPDDTFDVIVEYGALHHLDFEKAMSELCRVMKPGGAMICTEALRHNPFIQMYRRLTPHLRTQWEVEHILTTKHLEVARQFFGIVKPRFFHLTALAAVPLRKTRMFKTLRGALDRVDSVLLRIPGVRRYAWIVVFELREPKKSRNK